MSVYQQYYSNLEDSSDNDDHDDDDDDDDSSTGSSSSIVGNSCLHGTKASSLWHRSILHLDVDCFYVQCEELDRGLRRHHNGNNHDHSQRPLAIGQKHIVVTCNYVARARGVTKLQSKERALQACPDLMLVDGSDLRHYKQHSQRVYQSFRKILQLLIESVGCNIAVASQKTAMDELLADLSNLVDVLWEIESTRGNTEVQRRLSQMEERILGTHQQQQQQSKHCSFVPKTFVFGKDRGRLQITEDQSGTTVVLGDHTAQSQNDDRFLAPTRRNVHTALHSNSNSSSNSKQTACQRRLELAVEVSKLICRGIFHHTGFFVSAGISISPLLAKLAVVQKPKTVNLLLPWESPSLLYSLPLRKLVGRQTHKALCQRLLGATAANLPSATANLPNANRILTVRDVLCAPRDTIVKALQTLQNCKDSQKHCDLLLDQCRGLDETPVVDDGGGLSKTVSVENSFRRGTLTTHDSVAKALVVLCSRLLPLVGDRVAWSNHNHAAASPTTIRLTIREAPPQQTENETTAAAGHRTNSHRSITKSKQVGLTPLQQRVLIQGAKHAAAAAAESSSNHIETAVRMLRDASHPLLRQLLFQREKSGINVTRMNIAVANFQDAIVKSHPQQSTKNWMVNTANGKASTTPTTINGRNLSQRVGDENSNIPNTNFSQINRYQQRNSRLATPLPALSKKRKSPSSSAPSRKFSRTRIDQFFAKKPR